MEKILIVEDDENINDLMKMYLEKEGYEVYSFLEGNAALDSVEKIKPDIILLDLMLPDTDGYNVCTKIRKKLQTPIIMVTAKGEVFDKVLGLELGADDFLVKPFDPKELIARIRAVLRRSFSKIDQDLAEQVNFENLSINKSNYSVIYHNEKLELPPKELELLYFLALHPNKVFTRDQLLDEIWGYEYFGESRTVDVHVKRLREKFTQNDSWQIKTVWGVGYKFQS